METVIFLDVCYNTVIEVLIMMKHLTKIFVTLAIVLFVIGYYLQASGHEDQGVKLLLAAIMFMICAFINRSNDRKKNKK